MIENDGVLRVASAIPDPPFELIREVSKTGKLPAVKDRLPKEPLVYLTGNMPDGVGVYGDVMRHVIGGRPQGWNYAAGQIQGWGGVDIGMYECLTRTGPLFEIKAVDGKTDTVIASDRHVPLFGIFSQILGTTKAKLIGELSASGVQAALAKMKKEGCT